jgi:hypothetical protein
MCTLSGAQSTAYPTGKSYTVTRLLGLRTHAMVPAGDPCTLAYRNAMVHLEVKDRQMAADHKTILETMEGFLHTDLERLLEEHCHLSFSDFTALASGSTKDKLEWISEIDSALGAASQVARGSRHAVQTRYSRGRRPLAQTEYESVLVDAEGSMRWWKRCKWS